MASKGYKTTTGGGTDLGNVTFSTALSMAQATNSKIDDFLSKFDSTSNTSAGTAALSNTGGSFDVASFRRGEERSMAGINITVDTAQTGDKFAALIAESLQIAQKSGVSFGIAGGL